MTAIKKWIEAGTDVAHGGNALYDATLYSHGRADFDVYERLYGLHPSIMSSIDDDAVIRVLNRHAADISSKFKVVSQAYEESFRRFIDALNESSDSRVHFEEPQSDLTMAYWKFFQCIIKRVIGSVLHVEPIVVADGPHEYTRDWAFIELHPNKFDWSTFAGNKVYVAEYVYRENGLLQAFGVTKDDEIRQPQHLDVHGEKALLVVKNGLTTGTTVGRVNGLESFTRAYLNYGIKHTSIE
ncbi:hypothetical protein Egran_00016, partial [Elaphomyces granulatus]